MITNDNQDVSGCTALSHAIHSSSILSVFLLTSQQLPQTTDDIDGCGTTLQNWAMNMVR